jgi:tetratricopeptide (TPR) repeat protein/serine/threonine protein kinase
MKDSPQLLSIFCEARERRSAEERAAYLDEACGDDADLRARVEELLGAEPAVGNFLQGGSSHVKLAGTVDDPVTERPGAVIGPYKLMEQIGEGGMGLVFVAEQQQPVRRKVALKVIKPGMDSRQVIARFEAERQALALMDHPNIARVHDGGETASGRPYFVMELVKGVPITEFCDQSQVAVRERLDLFVHVCQAVQHAHQKGIIHRDIKPSNVLVMSQDGTPVVKVIDFGVAKAIGQQLTDKTIYTQFAQMVGTPLYMSPEQAGQSGVDVDTRTDIYALGVLLYELLTGTTPFDKERLRKVDYDEMRRIIREEEPPRPSTRISTLGQAATTASANRKSDPKRLSQLVRGELDWIVMKALEKDRNRRYETASAFAADVQRYLHDEPVLACPPSLRYRLRKFVRRNKRGLVIAGLMLFFLVLLGTGAGWVLRDQAVRQRETERAGSAALVQAETLLAEGDKQHSHPERWQATARLALAALEKAQELLATGAPTEELAGRVQLVRAAVAAAVTESRLLVELDRIRLKQAAVKDEKFDLAQAAPLYAKALGEYGIDLASPEAAAARVRASRLREALLAALGDWARSTSNQGERRRLIQVLQAAEPEPTAFRVRWLAAALQRRAGAALVRLADEPEVQALPAADLVSLARDLRLSVNEAAAAERLLRAAVERYPSDFWLNHDLGSLLVQQKPRGEEAVRYLTVALALRSDSPGVHLNLGVALNDKGDREGAIRRYRAALQIDPRYATAHLNLGNALRDKGDLHGAIKEFQAAIRFKKDYHQAHFQLGLALHAKGRLEAAIIEYRKALSLHPEWALTHNNLGNVLRDKGDVDGAIAAYKKALRLDKDLPEAHFNLAQAMYSKDHLEEAITEYQKTIDLLGSGKTTARRDPEKDLSEAYHGLGSALAKQSRFDKAIAAYRQAIHLKKDYPKAHCNLGLVLIAKDRVNEAIEEFQEAISLKKDFAEAHYELGRALEKKGHLDMAIAAYQQAIGLKKDYAEAYCNLGALLCDKKKAYDAAISAFQKAIRFKKDFHQAYYNLGNALSAKGRMDEAIVAYRRAIDIKRDHAQAHCSLGHALQRLGRFTEALAAFQTGHKLGSERPAWSYPSAKWVREVERLVALDAKLARVLKKESQPVNATECLQLAWLCRQPYKQLNAAAAGFFREALAAKPNVVEDPRNADRYMAACYAALAGCGQGKDADKLDDKERAGLRQQALDWLRAELTAWNQRLKDGRPQDVALAQRVVPFWQRDARLEHVRGKALAKLPEAERLQWQRLWADVETLRQCAAGTK